MNEIEEISEKASEIVIESRERRRDDLNRSRGIHRASAFDKNRFLESEILSESDIKGLCSRIKRRKHCTEEDLEKLTNAFFQSESNITEFLKVTGAINILIKELLGSDRQLLASQCLCNLSLGDEVACSKVATFAGAYLMILLKNLSNAVLIKIIIWTIENLITSGTKALDLLMSQELLKGIIFIINSVSDVQIKTEALHTLDIIVDKKCTQFTHNEMEEVIKCIFNFVSKHGSDLHALQSLHRILSTRAENVTVDGALLEKIFGNIVKVDSDEKVIEVSLQILITLSGKDIQYFKSFLEFLVLNNVKLSGIINEIVSTPKLYGLSRKYLLIVSIIACGDDGVQKYLEYDDVMNNLRIPKMLGL